MLTHLHIQNYALIESLDMDLHEGFSVITGETGAGKSILLGAISLLLGGRSDSRAIQTGKTRCVLEAEFNLEGCGLDGFFEENELDFDGRECILRRELTAQGKSRAFINDTPATVAQLRELGSHLIDVHSQHQNLLLGTQDFQISVLDTLAGNQALLAAYREQYGDWQKAQKALREAEESLQRGRDDEDYLRFQLQQLDELQPKPGEEDELQDMCRKLEHAQEIASALLSAENTISGDDSSILDALRQVRSALSGIARYSSEAQEIADRVETCAIELKDISGELSSRAQDIEYDPARLEVMQSRLDSIYSLQQKHHVSSNAELIEVWQDMQQRLSLIDNSEEHLNQLRKQVGKAMDELKQTASAITRARGEAARTVESQMCLQLQTLGMQNVVFRVEIKPSEAPMQNGMDSVTYYFSANKNSAPQPIAQVASGGEIARVMLSLKALISSCVSLPTIIFDEIDTGVSGQTAQAMARIMRRMGDEGRQVISITHLPQIASMGNNHYKVYKEDTEEATLSHIVSLEGEARVREIANMLSGSQVTEAALDNARTLLQSAD